MVNHHKIAISAVHPTGIYHRSTVGGKQLRTKPCSNVHAVVPWSKIVTSQVMHCGRPNEETVSINAYRIEQACPRSVPSADQPPFSVTRNSCITDRDQFAPSSR